jgi:tetratricopeptide (TPR) repeat protein
MVEIDEAIRLSERRARFSWLASLLWLAMMIIVFGAFVISIRRFDQTQSEINRTRDEVYQTQSEINGAREQISNIASRISNLEKTLIDQQSRADNLISELEKNKSALSALEKTTLDRLDDQEKRIHALGLQFQDSRNITSVQREFLKQEETKSSISGNPATALTLKGISQFLDGKYDIAYDLYNEAIHVNPNFVDAYVGRARAERKLHKQKEAIDDLTHALNLSEDANVREYVLAERARTHMEMEQFDAAQKDISDWGELAKNKAQERNWTGLVNLARKDWTSAEKDFRVAAESEETPMRKAGYLENIGLIYLDQANWQRAFEWSQEVSKIYDGSGWNAMIQALALDKLGRTDERDVAIRNFVQRNFDPKDVVNDMTTYVPDDLATLATQWVRDKSRSN